MGWDLRLHKEKGSYSRTRVYSYLLPGRGHTLLLQVPAPLALPRDGLTVLSNCAHKQTFPFLSHVCQSFVFFYFWLLCVGVGGGPQGRALLWGITFCDMDLLDD